jgi:acetyl-CoA synthetase
MPTERLIYTTGTTSKPKGLGHTGLGFLVGSYANVSSRSHSMRTIPTVHGGCRMADVSDFALVGGLANGAKLY